MKSWIEKIKGRKIYYYGAGIIGQECLREYRDVNIEGFIVSHESENAIDGVPIFGPEKLEEKGIFVVVTVICFAEIKDALEKKGYIEGEDFVDYTVFFGCERPDYSLEKLKYRIKGGEIVKGASLLFVPFFNSRVSDQIVNFFGKYFEAHKEEVFYYIESSRVVHPKKIESIIGCQMINTSFSYKQISNGDEQNNFIIDRKLDINEEVFVRGIEEEIECRKMDENYDEAILRYKYYKSLLLLLQPTTVFFWGNFTRRDQYLSFLCKKNYISMRFMEHGVVPGTIQCGWEGNAGYGEIPNHADVFLKRAEKENISEYNKIRDYIIKKKIDTGIFSYTKEDDDQLDMLLKGHKTVFLVGCGCYEWEVKEGSSFWKKHVSCNVDSAREAFDMTKELCKKYDWNLIYKPHPGSPEDISIDDYNTEGIAIVRNASIDKLIEISDVVVSIMSAVHYKALMYEKPLVELGKYTDYGQGVAYEVHDDFEKQIIEALEFGMTEKQKERFSHHVMMLLHYNHWDDLTHEDFPYGLKLTENLKESR